MKNFINELSENIIKAEESVNELKEALQTTNEFLNECKKEGIKTVSIGRKTKKIKATNDWPFDFGNSVFADEKDKKDKCPAIWKVTDKFDFNGSVGNGGQHSIKDNAKLIDGVYTLKNGKWYKRD